MMNVCWWVISVLVFIECGKASISAVGSNGDYSFYDKNALEEKLRTFEGTERVLVGQKGNAQSSVGFPERNSIDYNVISANAEKIEDILRQTDQWPVIVIVDRDPASLKQVRRLMNVVSQTNILYGNFILIIFDDEGAEVSENPQYEGTSALNRAISSLEGFSAKKEGAGFSALLKAGEIMQPRTSVLLFTGRPAHDERFAQIAWKKYIKNYCKLFVWWTDNGTFQGTGAERIYKELAENTKGTFYPLVVPETISYVECNTTNDDKTSSALPEVVLAIRKNIIGTALIPVLVDSTIEKIFLATANVTKVTVTMPSGELIDLPPTSLQGGPCPLYTSLDTLNQRGWWQFETHGVGGSTVSTSDLGYDVIVKGTSGLQVVVQNVDGETWRKDGLILTARGMDLKNITGLAIMDENGQEISKLSYRQRIRGPRGQQITEIIIDKDDLPNPQAYYVSVEGTTAKGEQFTRITPTTPNEEILVRLDEKSNLVVPTNKLQVIKLYITNNGTRPSNMIFNGKSMQNILLNISPVRQRLHPKETITIDLHFYAPNNLIGMEDTVHIRIQGELSISEISMLISISDNQYTGIKDIANPTLRYKIQDNCKESSQGCYSKEWTMQATIQDQDSGIREVMSLPRGISFPTPLLIGTKAPVTISYRASCCDPIVIISVTDLQNNKAVYTTDVNESKELTPGEIAGIIVGVIVLVILIIAIIVLIVFCRKKQSHTFHSQQVVAN